MHSVTRVLNIMICLRRSEKSPEWVLLFHSKRSALRSAYVIRRSIKWIPKVKSPRKGSERSPKSWEPQPEIANCHSVKESTFAASDRHVDFQLLSCSPDAEPIISGSSCNASLSTMMFFCRILPKRLEDVTSIEGITGSGASSSGKQHPSSRGILHRGLLH